MRALAVLLTLAAATSAFASTAVDIRDVDPSRRRGATREAGRSIDGANHHLGDDSFVARYGRAPTRADGEKLRMRVHLEHVRDLLAARAPTRPELARRRAELLGYLGDYIAKGITPRNTYVAWRNPVFIDRDGNVCAVGYLIERSVGRTLPETIAARHRLDYLEDIAGAMPEVAAWVETSGLTLVELASIQPGYEGPEVQHLAGWFAPKGEHDYWTQGTQMGANGKYHEDNEGITLDGTIARKQMVGTWTRKREGKVIGSGTFRGGSGTWTSLRPDGKRMASGPFANSRPHGQWQFFHPSGRIAARGAMVRGRRHGAWTFFYDGRGGTKIATGTFRNGEVVGDWSHFDPKGKLVASSSGRAWTHLLLRIAPGKDGVRHEVVQGEPAASNRLDAFALAGERLFIVDRTEMHDGAGNLLVKTDGTWYVSGCAWSADRKRAASAGQTAKLYRHLVHDRYARGSDVGADPTCKGSPVAVPAARARRYDTMLASRAQQRAPIPKFEFFDTAPELEYVTADDGDDTETETDASQPPGDNPADMTTYLASHMTWYMEWPHIDRTFMAVYHSLPGYGRRDI